MKVDLRKAYDSIEWCFLQSMMAELGFPYKFIKWTMECISTVSYSLVINGGLAKPFPGKRGIRQGDPMSPYLFVVAMEYLQRELSLMITNRAFKFHPRCKSLGVTHICFADDLLLCYKAELPPVQLIQDAFRRFSVVSRLQ
ncbi:secreted RxLR effector protein 78-like [Lycium barbarum]|uniref:secreted RxLR effector protein 78-like n=1 Tax=Lycium barbarum TaxID=112863 RepID=UPI00293F4D1E|nr:secreted RxLR effector protein 78-like [Lycium barbarum]